MHAPLSPCCRTADLLNQNWELQAFCRRHGIQFQAYSSMGGQWLMQAGGARNPVLEHPTLLDVAGRLGRTPGQVALRWALQHGQVRCAVLGAAGRVGWGAAGPVSQPACLWHEAKLTSLTRLPHAGRRAAHLAPAAHGGEPRHPLV